MLNNVYIQTLGTLSLDGGIYKIWVGSSSQNEALVFKWNL
jgi:hypothetical protein